MRIIAYLCLIGTALIQTSCVFIEDDFTKTSPEEEETVMVGDVVYYANEEEFKFYVDRINIDLYFLFNYTRALNKLAKSRGVEPAAVKPICEFVEWGRLRDPPDFKFSKNINSLEEMNGELVEYIKVTKELYKLQADEFKNLEAVARELCTY